LNWLVLSEKVQYKNEYKLEYSTLPLFGSVFEFNTLRIKKEKLWKFTMAKATSTMHVRKFE